MKRSTLALTLAFAISTLNTNAQQPGGGPPPPRMGKSECQDGPDENDGPGDGRGGHRPPSPEKLAERLMKDFDADKDGKLSKEELTKALQDMHDRRPPGGPGNRENRGGKGGQRRGPDFGNQRQPVGPNGPKGQDGGHQGPPPPPDQVAAEMIEKFASDKTGLTQEELVKALEAHRPPHHGRPEGE